MDIEPYIAGIGIMVICLIIYAMSVLNEAVLKEKQERENAETLAEAEAVPKRSSIILAAGAQGLFLGFLMGVMLILLIFTIFYVLNGLGMGQWSLRSLLRTFAGIFKSTWPSVVIGVTTLIYGFGAMIDSAESKQTPFMQRARRKAAHQRRVERRLKRAQQKAAKTEPGDQKD